MKLLPLAYPLLLGLATGAHSEPYFVASAGTSTPSKSGYADDSAMRFGLGYRFASTLSAEASYVDLGTSTINATGGAAQAAQDIGELLRQQFPGIAVQIDSVTGTLAINGVAVALQAESRITRALNVYGRLGAFSWVCDQTHSLNLRLNDQPPQESTGSSSYRGVDLVVGVGANFRFSQHWGVTLEATNYASESLDSRYVGGGVKYYF